MTAPPDPALPKDPAEYRPRPLMGLGFWALMALCVLCVLAGVGVAFLAPRFLPVRSPAPPPAVEAAPPADLAAPAQAPAPAATLRPSAAAATATAEIARLNARILDLESEGERTSEAAAAALAAAALVQASQGSRPFARELTALQAVAPDLPELAALTPLAQAGAPSRAALAASFPDYAARAATAARRPVEGAGLQARVAYALTRIVSVRRVSDVSGSGADAVLARAERALEEGDVDAALDALAALPPPARAAIAPWRDRAERRAEIDRQAAALRARALRDLAEGSQA